ncbi:MAG: LysR family transcriptional regulator [Alphaproteobacteria bacterium]|nr:LysR family transcriptional regulator [Alphaproteobacteria bacterium]MBM3951266.1 LysR family transcriptional regulator [Rhodospirillales bacterium]
MNLKQLETLYWIGRLGNFRAVAEHLNTTQSNVSMRILRFEEYLGERLFHRTLGMPRLTQKGRAMMDIAERAVELSLDIRRVSGIPMPLTGTVKLGVSEIIALTWLPKFMTRLQGAFPGLTVTLDMDFTDSMRRKLENGDLDLILVPGPIGLPGIRTEYLGSVAYRWIAARSLRLPQRCFSASDIARLSIITLPRTSILHAVAEKWFKDGNARAPRVYACNSLSLVSTLVGSGLGISLLPYDIVTGLVNRRRVKALDTMPAMVPIKYYAAYVASKDDTIIQTIAKLARRASTLPNRPEITILPRK